MQVVLAGKAHPRDEEAKHVLKRLFGMKGAEIIGQRVVFLDDYDLATAAWLVRGCDVWLNVPRPPLEASGTSGMKSVINGGLQLSVLDGWWAEGYDGDNGWAIPGEVDDDHEAQDDRDVAELHRPARRGGAPDVLRARRAGVAGGLASEDARLAPGLSPAPTAAAMMPATMKIRSSLVADSSWATMPTANAAMPMTVAARWARTTRPSAKAATPADEGEGRGDVQHRMTLAVAVQGEPRRAALASACSVASGIATPNDGIRIACRAC